MKDNKYVVFKREDFIKLMNHFDAPLQATGEIINCALPDAVVIRTKDPLAGPALHAYAAGAALPASVLANFGGKDQSGNVRALREVADYFHDRAVEADEYAASNPIKIPD